MKHSFYHGLYPSILVIDDDISSVKALNLIFAKMGWEIYNAFDGESARRALALDSYDLIILDWNLPDMNGNEIIAAADVSGFVKPGQKIPVITYTKNKYKDLLQPNLRNFKFIDHWQKPMVFADICKRATSINRWR